MFPISLPASHIQSPSINYPSVSPTVKPQLPSRYQRQVTGSSYKHTRPLKRPWPLQACPIHAFIHKGTQPRDCDPPGNHKVMLLLFKLNHPSLSISFLNSHCELYFHHFSMWEGEPPFSLHAK